MVPDEPSIVANQYAESLVRMKRISNQFFPSVSTGNLEPIKSYGSTATQLKKNFHKVKGAKSKHIHFYSTSMHSSAGPTQSQIERFQLQRKLEENRMSMSEKTYFNDRIQVKIKEFKQKAAAIAGNMEKKLDRIGVFPHNVNLLRSSSMQTVLMRNMMIKRLPEFVSHVKQEIKDLRNGQSIRVITALDKVAQEELEKERRQDLLVRLKKAVTNQVGEQTNKRPTAEEKNAETSLAGKLTHIINDKLPLRRVKPLEMKLQFTQVKQV